MLDRFC